MAKRLCYRLVNDDMMPNPVRSLPRNMPCGCGSGKKFKKCCFPLIQKFIRKDALPEFRRTMALFMEGKVAW